MLPTLLLALAPLLPTNAPVSCDDVRRVHALVVSEGLDDASLRAIEAKHCAPRVVSPADEGRRGAYDDHRRRAPSKECIDLRIMSVLGHAGGAKDLEEIDALMNVVCSIGLSRPHVTWRNGTTARYANGAWSWPSGTSAKYTNGAWSWPSGASARYSNGNWSLPSGASAAREQVIAPACARDPDACRSLARLHELDEDLATATLLALAWSHRAP